MTRVLFVDDEPIVLRAFERLLRIRRAPWKARFATGGHDALALLAAEDFDIVVSDLGMPGMDGVAFLGEVRDHFPHVARLALTGQSAIADGVRALPVVHQWFAKPCEFTTLCATIERIGWVQGLVVDRGLRAELSALAGLPSPVRGLAELEAALGGHAPIADAVALIEADPAAVAKLLQLVNGAFFASAERMTSVERAVALIGPDLLRRLLTGAGGLRGGDVPADLGERSREVACRAGALVPASLAADAFAAGLLHDLGALVIPAPASAALRGAAGALLLGLWGLPIEIVTAVAYHHDPAAAPAPDDPILCAVARAVAA